MDKETQRILGYGSIGFVLGAVAVFIACKLGCCDDKCSSGKTNVQNVPPVAHTTKF